MSSVNKTQVRGKQLEADEAVRTERAGFGSGELLPRYRKYS